MKTGYLPESRKISQDTRGDFAGDSRIASTVAFLRDLLVEKPGNSTHLMGNHFVLLTGLKMALAALENWDGYSPAKRQSIIESIHGLIADSRVS